METTETKDYRVWPAGFLEEPSKFDAKRFCVAAHYAQQGAVNSLPLIRSASDCLKSWRDAGGDFNGRECPPYRLLMHQLAFLCGVDPIGAAYNATEYSRDTRIVQSIAQDKEIPADLPAAVEELTR